MLKLKTLNPIILDILPMQDQLLEEDEVVKSPTEQNDGISNYNANLLYEIETQGANIDDVFWFEHKEEILQFEKQDLVETLDVGGYGQLGTAYRTLKLTPKGRLMMLIGRREATTLKHLPGRHNQKEHGREKKYGRPMVVEEGRVSTKKIDLIEREIEKYGVDWQDIRSVRLQDEKGFSFINGDGPPNTVGLVRGGVIYLRNKVSDNNMLTTLHHELGHIEAAKYPSMLKKFGEAFRTTNARAYDKIYRMMMLAGYNPNEIEGEIFAEAFALHRTKGTGKEFFDKAVLDFFEKASVSVDIARRTTEDDIERIAYLGKLLSNEQSEETK